MTGVGTSPDAGAPPGRARPIVLAAPSGTGKTTIARILVDEEPDFAFSISATTREPRTGEVNGVDYHFVDEARFREMIARGEMAEWAEVHGRLYGTPRRELERAAEAGVHAVLDIDVQGAAQIGASVEDAILVFILPPNAEEMMLRLTSRGTETDDQIQRRLRSALEELGRVGEFHHVVVNSDLDDAVAEARGIARGTGTGRSPSEEAARIEALRADLARILETRFN